MRIHLGIRTHDRVDLDDRTSKHNHGSIKGCSIENTLLEKRLMMDHEKTGEANVHAMSDLEACCDRQTPEL